ncbi:MAG: hypothetical protein WBP26_03760 [Candidatus Saccharimonadales bacterium]
MAVVAAMVVCVVPGNQAAAHTQLAPKGLLITPVRQYIDVTAGVAQAGNITVGNFTDKPLTVNLSVEQFSVSDYAYEYLLTSSKTDIVRLGTTSVVIQKDENKKIPFTLLAADDATPGGHYYTILATASITEGGVSSKVQAGSPLYITVAGKHITTNNLVGGSVQKFNVGSSIPFTLDIRNTGNVHYFVYTSGVLSGFLAEQSVSSSSHIVLPNTTRRLGGSIPAPLLPGVYKVTYGYKLEDKPPVSLESYVVYTPIWSYAALVLIIWLMVHLIRRKKRRRKKTASAHKAGNPDENQEKE